MLIAVSAASLTTRPARASEATSGTTLELAARNAAKKAKAAAFLDVQGCGIVVSTVAGVANRKTRTNATIGMPLRIGSVSKLFTAATIHRLAQRREVDLDQPVSSMLRVDDAPGVPGRSATLRQLLNHTAGVPDYYDLPNIRRWNWHQPLTPQRILTAIANHPVTAAPGVRYAYSNSGYHLAALAIERKVGRPFSALVSSEVIAPLGLLHTIYNEKAPGGDLHGYVGSKDWFYSAENTGPDGGITATLVDLRRTLRAFFLDNGPLRAAGEAMTAQPVETGRPRQQAGAGAEIRQSRDGLLMNGHTGNVEGGLTFAYAVPAYGLTMIGHLSASDKDAFEELLRTTAMTVQSACQSR